MAESPVTPTPDTGPQIGKPLGNLRAHREEWTDDNLRHRRGNRVRVSASLDWLKHDQMGSVCLTPEQAIDFAAELIRVARFIQTHPEGAS